MNENSKAGHSFFDFVTGVKEVGALLGKGAILAPPIISLSTNLGPPWLSSVALSFLTSLVEIIVLMFIFQWGKKHIDKQLKRASSIALCVLVISLTGYLFLFGFFVQDMPSPDSRDVKGIYYTQEARKKINPNYPEKMALAGASFDPTLIWEPWTVYSMRTTVVLVWLFFFASLAAYFGLFTIRERKRI